MKKTINSKHSRSVFIFTLLSLFMCMSSGKVSAEELKPVIKIDKTSYTSSGTEVTLKLWMFNWKKTITTTLKDYNARFIGDVYLYIDGKEVGKLNDMWTSISGSSYLQFKDTPGDVGKYLTFRKSDGTHIGYAQFKDSKGGQTCPYNSNTSEKSWLTVDLQLSFKKIFSYYGHKITVKGKWQDQSSGILVEKDVVLNTDINGFVRPINLKVQPSNGRIMFKWETQGYNSSASTDGTWELYKRDIFKTEKLRSNYPAKYDFMTIDKSQYTCSKDYILAFRPKACEGEVTDYGLTTKMAATEHQMNDDDICQLCGHSYFRYKTSDGSKVTLFYKDFGANLVGQKRVDDMWAIECDGPITKIPQRAFLNSMITGNFVIPNTVTEIGDQAFEGCTGFTGNWTIPNSVTTIGNSAFKGCTGFTGNLTIPNTVKTIGKYAFSGCTGFTGNLTIPNSVTTIDGGTFYECSGFTGNLIIPNSVKTIGGSAFMDCTGFTGYLTLPNSITTIGDYAFSGCTGFTGNLTIPNSVTTIGNKAFLGCKGFTGNLIIPNSVKTIGYTAFYECSGFTGNLIIPNSVTTIGGSTFYNCTGFTGDLTIPNSVKNIGDDAFTGCTGFTGNLTIPNSVTTIGNKAFLGCKGFTGNLIIPNSVKTIGYIAFFGCTGFTGNLTIPNSVTTIGYRAFEGCTGFTGDVSLPKSLEEVGYYSFENCNNIQTVNFQSLPKGIGNQPKKTVSLSDDSYIYTEATGIVDEISYTRQMSSNWGTLVLPYSLTLTGNEPYRLYAIDNMEGEELVLKQLDGEVAAGTPCVVKRNGSESELTFGNDDAKLNMAIDGKTVGDMTFNGTYWTKEVTDGYVIAKDCFWNVAELMKNKPETVKGVKVGPFRAWLDGNVASGPARLSMRIDGSTTGIDAIDALNDAEAEYYDLSGKRLDEPQKGVNIVRMKSGKTKKIIIK